MEQTGSLPCSIVVRRFIRPSEPIEIVQAHGRSTTSCNQTPMACRVTSWTDKETQVYLVFLPENFAVRPVDWRRFAYDHAKVNEFVSTCVRDNLLQSPPSFFGDTWTQADQKHLEHALLVALGDLESIFDVNSVECADRRTDDDGEMRVTISGEYKNGGKGMLTILHSRV